MSEKFKTFQRWTEESVGTHYCGSIDTTYTALLTVFGKPIESSVDAKVRAEWHIQFTDGVFVTIYDYKAYGRPVEEVVDWHIRGRDNSQDVVNHIVTAMLAQQQDVKVRDVW